MKTITNSHGCEFTRGEVIGTVVKVNGERWPMRHIGPCSRCADYSSKRSSLVSLAADAVEVEVKDPETGKVRTEVPPGPFFRKMDELYAEKYG